MTSEKSADVAQRAKMLYEQQLREKLEATHMNQFVAIEPDSGDYYFGTTLSEAIQASRGAHPDRLPFALRIGHPSAVSLGVMIPCIRGQQVPTGSHVHRSFIAAISLSPYDASR